MKASSYKNGSAALRRMISDPELRFCRQFARFNLYVTGNRRHGRQLRGIWNTKTENITAFINHKNVVFIRPNSVYAGQLLGSDTHKVIKNNKLTEYSNQVDRSTRRYSQAYLMAEEATDRLIKNADKPKAVYLGKIREGSDFLTGFFNDSLQELLTIYDLPNSKYAARKGMISYDHDNDGNVKMYINVEDVAEIIAREERLERIKREVAELFLDNVREIAQDSIVSGRSLNPLQFTYHDDGEDIVGIIKLQSLDLQFRRNIDIRQWIDVQTVINIIRFRDRIGSLAEQGISEQRSDNREEGISGAFLDYARRYRYVSPSPWYAMSEAEMRGVQNIVVPSYTETTWAEEASMPEDSMPDQAEWHSATMVRDDYPTGSEFDPTTSG